MNERIIVIRPYFNIPLHHKTFIIPNADLYVKNITFIVDEMLKEVGKIVNCLNSVEN